ncbi:MAG: histidinol-phosphatase [Planctomycetes bacterium]|nr:histidinol-phosphatase [Planctomycetota bacterium]
MYETHTHTPLCKHAIGEPEEYAQVASDRGLRGLIVTCHNPMPDGFGSHVRMAPEQLDEYRELVGRARARWAGRLDIRLGIEADYFPGYEAWLERQLTSVDFDYVLGAVHPQLPEFEARYGGGSEFEFQRTYFRLLAEAAETRLFDCLAHPDVIKSVRPAHWQPEAILDDVRRALDRIAPTGVALEINTSGAHKDYPEMNPFPVMLAEARRREIPVVIGSDAHRPERVGALFEQALDLAERAGYQQVSYFLGRKRHAITLDAFREVLRPVQADSTSDSSPSSG